jgi:hypothetical protein
MRKMFRGLVGLVGVVFVALIIYGNIASVVERSAERSAETRRREEQNRGVHESLARREALRTAAESLVLEDSSAQAAFGPFRRGVPDPYDHPRRLKTPYLTVDRTEALFGAGERCTTTGIPSDNFAASGSGRMFEEIPGLCWNVEAEQVLSATFGADGRMTNLVIGDPRTGRYYETIGRRNYEWFKVR